MSQYLESAIQEGIGKEFALYSAKGMKNLGVSPDNDPVVIVASVGDFITKWQKEKRNPLLRFFAGKPNTVDIALCLGAVWGDQVCRAFGWQWVCLTDTGQEYYAVVSPDRAYVVLPTYSIRALLDEVDRDNATTLFFNMIEAGDLPPSSPEEYLSIDMGAKFPST